MLVRGIGLCGAAADATMQSNMENIVLIQERNARVWRN